MAVSPVPGERPGLRLTYPVELGGELQSREIPLVVGVLGDFSGLPVADRPSLRDRRFVQLAVEEVRQAAALRGPEDAIHRLLRLVELADSDPAVLVRGLDVTKEELAADLQRAPSIDQSALWRLVYEHEYGTFSGEPFAMILAGFPIAHSSADMRMLEGFARIGADAGCLFVATAAPQMLSLPRWESLPPPEQLESLFASRAYADWHALRDREEAKFVALTVFADAYDVVRSLVDTYIKTAQWSDAGSPLTDAAGGAPDEAGDIVLARNGFVVGTAPLRDARTAQRPRRYHQPERSAEAEATMHLTNILTSTQFLRAATCLSRDSIGSFRTMEDTARMLNQWLNSYIDDGTSAVGVAAAARKPLAEARLELRDILGLPGQIEVILHLRINPDGVISARCARHAMRTVPCWGY